MLGSPAFFNRHPLDDRYRSLRLGPFRLPRKADRSSTVAGCSSGEKVARVKLPGPLAPPQAGGTDGSEVDGNLARWAIGGFQEESLTPLQLG